MISSERWVSPVTGTTAYAYDPAGHMTATTDANGATTARTYDALGRVTSALSTRAGAPSEEVSWTYDTGPFGAGRLARMDDPTGFTMYAWTRAGQLAKEEKSVAGAVWTTTFHYDAAGNRTRVGYPSGRQVTYAYDFAGRPVSALDGSTTLVSAAAYLPFGPLTSLTYGNSTTKTMTYDARYRPATNALAGPLGTIAAYQYGYDEAGNITAIDDLVDASWSRSFGYDDLHRIVTANGGASLWGAGTYQYDAMGNMTSLALGTMRAASFAYAGTTPKLTSVTENGLPRAVEYDAAGNEILAGTTASSYSPRNHLLESEGLRYAYDGRGIRTLTEVTGGQGASLLDDPAVRIADASLVRREPDDDRSLLGRVLDRFFPRTSLSLGVEADLLGPMSLPPTGSRKVNVYLPELQLLTESGFTTGTPVPAWDYVWFAGQVLAQIEVTTGATRWTFNDHLGTPLLQTDVTGVVVWRLEQEPYGAEVAFRAGLGIHQPLRFPGQEQVLDTETSYNVFRWYRGEWGRYSQADPIDVAGGVNLFLYASANPAKFADLYGLAPCCDCPEGLWNYMGGAATFAIGKGWAYVEGTFTCASKPSVKLRVKGKCDLKGLIAVVGIAGEFSFSPIFPTKACNKEDLMKKTENAWSGFKWGIGWSGNFLQGSGTLALGPSYGGGVGEISCKLVPAPLIDLGN